MMCNFKTFLFWISLPLLTYSYILDFEYFCFSYPFFIFHTLKGLKSIINDYIYFQFLKIFFTMFLRVSALELIRYFFDLLL